MTYSQNLKAQLSNQPGANGIQTFVNPILPGDHPDQTLLRMGNDFYSTGSNFHFTPYLPILHSTDLVHWEIIARVIPPTSSIPSNDAPQAGTWQGALAFFNNKYWVYFSNNAGGGQYFCNANNMAGPWSAPVRVNTNTGVYGYDNSIFVDDDGTPYMLLKNGQALNGLQRLGMDGQPVGQAINMNWVNAPNAAGVRPYSWAEGPVMCKRNGRYYLFVAGDVSGGQFVLSTANLTAGESAWTRHGTFWQNATSPGGFTGPNHITQPIMLDDGTWWCLSHAYDNGGWEGQGRQSHLHQVVWDANGVPKGIPVSINPLRGPGLPNTNNTSYNFIHSDYFETTTLSLNWHFLNKTYASTSRYSLSERPGYMRLKPGTGYTHLLQKDKGKYYSLTTKVEINATANGQQAGIRMTSGNDDVTFTLYSGYNNGKKIGMSFEGVATEVNNVIGNVVWLRVERALHILTCFYSADGLTWTQLGTRDISNLDKSQPNYNQWVGTSVGLYTSAINADFDQFSYRYGFVPIRVEGRNNWYGVTFANRTPGRVVTNSTSGDWLMLAGVDLGAGTRVTSGIEVNASSTNANGSLEVWLDDIGGNGTRVATLAIPNTGGNDIWTNVTANFNSSGQHDVYLRWIGGSNSFSVNTIRFISGAANPSPVVSISSPANNSVLTEGDNITINATVSISSGSITKVDFYNGTTLLGTDATSPYSYTMSGAVAGNYVITAKATSNLNVETTSSVVNVQVAKIVYQTGTAPVIDGTIEGLWSNYPSTSIGKLNNGTVSSATDLSGNWKSMWDATNLYVLVQVTDDVKRNDGGTDVYNDDNVEIYMDMFNTKGTTYGTNDHQYTFRWNDATAVYEINGHSVTGITRVITNTTTGYVLEVSIPWSTIGGTVAVNNLHGFEVMINDDDDGGARDGKMAWIASVDDTWSNPSLMGTIVLRGLNCTPPSSTITTTTATTFCQGGSVTLNANTGTGFTYQWKNGTTNITGGTTSSYTATTGGSYSVTVTNTGGCSATSTATTVTVNALPVITPFVQVNGGAWNQVTTATLCSGGTVVIGPQPNVATGWSWTGPNGYSSTSREITLANLQANQAGTYTATYTNASNCVTTTSFTITVNALPTATITTTTPTTFCQGGSVTLNANTGTGLTYQWRTGTANIAGATNASYTATASGDYNVQVSNANNCSATSTNTVVTVNATPTAPTTTAAPVYCQNATAVALSATGTNLKWYTVATGGTSTTTAPTPSTSTAGITSYYVSQTTNGCESSRTKIDVTINALPTATITTTTPTTFCQGGSVTLNANTGTGLTYQWYNGTTTTGNGSSTLSIYVSSGSYTVRVTNGNGCSATSTPTVVTVNATPTAPTITSPIIYCQNAVATSLSAPGANLKWYTVATGGTSVTAAPTPSTATAGTTSYYVSQTTNGCESGRAKIDVTINPTPTATITTTTPTTIVEGGSVTLTANTGTGLSYQWRTGTTNIAGATNASYTATTAGSYNVVVTNANNCSQISSATTVSVTSNEPSQITILSPQNNSTQTGAIDISVNITDNDGNIVLVEYLDGTTVIGSNTTGPYGYTWTNPTMGSHEIRVRVTDSNGGVTTSSPVTIDYNPLSTGVQSTNTIKAVVYPNPTSGEVMVETQEDLSSSRVRMIDVWGNEIEVIYQMTGQGLKIDMSELSSGSYVLVISNTNSILRTKMTVIK
ncbi:MAG: sugar-binding protein [Cytophagaceae bacterium]